MERAACQEGPVEVGAVASSVAAARAVVPRILRGSLARVMAAIQPAPGGDAVALAGRLPAEAVETGGVAVQPARHLASAIGTTGSANPPEGYYQGPFAASFIYAESYLLWPGASDVNSWCGRSLSRVARGCY